MSISKHIAMLLMLAAGVAGVAQQKYDLNNFTGYTWDEAQGKYELISRAALQQMMTEIGLTTSPRYGGTSSGCSM